MIVIKILFLIYVVGCLIFYFKYRNATFELTKEEKLLFQNNGYEAMEEKTPTKMFLTVVFLWPMVVILSWWMRLTWKH